MDKADIFFGRTLKLTFGWKIRSHGSENGKKIMGEDPQSLENHGFPQISQLVLHSIKALVPFRASAFFQILCVKKGGGGMLTAFFTAVYFVVLAFFVNLGFRHTIGAAANILAVACWVVAFIASVGLADYTVKKIRAKYQAK